MPHGSALGREVVVGEARPLQQLADALLGMVSGGEVLRVGGDGHSSVGPGVGRLLDGDLLPGNRLPASLPRVNSGTGMNQGDMH